MAVYDIRLYKSYTTGKEQRTAYTNSSGRSTDYNDFSIDRALLKLASSSIGPFTNEQIVKAENSLVFERVSKVVNIGNGSQKTPQKKLPKFQGILLPGIPNTEQANY